MSERTILLALAALGDEEAVIKLGHFGEATRAEALEALKDDLKRVSAQDRLTPQDYREALLVQSACNLSGIVFSFNSVMKKICKEAELGGHGTEWKNQHPIAVLYAAQIEHLTGLALSPMYSQAYDACEKEALKTVKDGERPSWRSV